MGRLLPAPYARNFSTEYAGVVVFGSAEIIDDESDARHALQLLMDKYAPHLTPDVHYRPITSEEIAGTAILAGLMSFDSNLCRSHFFSSGPEGIFASRFISFHHP